MNDIISTALEGMEPYNQPLLDKLLIEADGTENKGKLGANALLGVSLAAAKAAANELGIPLYSYIGGVNAKTLPVPMMNILNGGKHADNNVDIQELSLIHIYSECDGAIYRCENDQTSSVLLFVFAVFLHCAFDFIKFIKQSGIYRLYF